MSSLALAVEPELQHTKETYPERKVCELLGRERPLHKKTLRRYAREGIRLPDGRRIYPRPIPLGGGRYVYEVDEVERVWRELKAAGAEIAEGVEDDLAEEVVDFRDHRSQSPRERRR